MSGRRGEAQCCCVVTLHNFFQRRFHSGVLVYEVNLYCPTRQKRPCSSKPSRLLTIHYVQNDNLALNLGGEKRFESIDEAHFDRLASRMEAPPKFLLDVVKQTVATARKEWPGIVREIGLPENLRDRLYGYWGTLSELLRIRQQ